jgi:putative chitinase
MNITRSDLARFCPRGNPVWLDAFANMADHWCQAYGVTTPQRWRHFAAQWHAETDGLSLPGCREVMRFKPERLLEVYDFRLGKALKDDPALAAEHGTKRRLAQHLAGRPDETAELVYGNRPELGNTHAGDGMRFIGRNPLQSTGRAAYELISKASGVDCVTIPATMEQPPLGVLGAFVEWAALGCNELADTDDVVAVSRRVNGGNNGLADRKRAYARALAIWPDVATSSKIDAAPAPRDERQQTQDAQTALTRLGYHCGNIDGVAGVLTQRALVAFQAEHALPPTGKIDAATLAVLAQSAPADLGARTTVTAKDLASRGSKTVTATQAGKGWMVRLKLLLGLIGYDELTGLGVIDAAITKAEALKSYADRIAQLPMPPTKILVVAALGLAAFLVWRALDNIEQRRVADARSGANLGR